MIKKYLGLVLLPGFIFLANIRVEAQAVTENASYYRWFDSRVGTENTGLYRGILYREQYRTINAQTKFLGTPDFHEGSLVYDGEPYVGQQLKYDIFGDELLIKIEDRLGGNTLQLFKDHVSEFVIDNHRFMNLKAPTGDSKMGGYYEISYENNGIQLLTKHHKRVFDKKDRSSLYYEFVDGKKEYVVHYKEEYYPVNGKRDLTALFPDMEDEIDDFYSQARTLRRDDPHAFMVGLIQRVGNRIPLN